LTFLPERVEIGSPLEKHPKRPPGRYEPCDLALASCLFRRANILPAFTFIPTHPFDTFSLLLTSAINDSIITAWPNY
jgi:hypothetical protein